jgi:hypothetical protein
VRTRARRRQPTEKVETRDVGPVNAMSLDELRQLRDRLLLKYPELGRLRSVE